MRWKKKTSLLVLVPPPSNPGNWATYGGILLPPSLADCSPLLKYGGKLSSCTTLAPAAVSRRSDPSSDVPRMPPPIPPLPPFRWHPSCRMVVGHPRLTWGTVLRDPGRMPFSSDSSLRWEPPSGPRLQVCRRLVASGLCFTGWRIPPLPPSSLAGRHTRPQGLSSLLPSHSLPPPPLHPSPPLLGC